MLLDTSLFGVKEGALKFVKILGWYAVSGTVAGVIAFAAQYQASIDQSDVIKISAFGLINAGLAALTKWLTTIKPETADQIG